MTGPIPASLTADLGDRYAIEREIGRGGMATVYLARDRKHQREVALKVLRADLGPVLGADRFLREIEIAARLSHPHILPLYDSGQVGTTLFYVMPFVAGESLRGLLNRTGLMDVDGAVEIVRRVAAALDYAHRQGILHRDIKPENILLPEGHAVVADFGIAKAVSDALMVRMTQTGIALGTPGYMSPEQAAGLTDLTATTDVYSVAVVTYEMLIGGLPGAWLTPDQVRAGRFAAATTEHRLKLDRLPAGMERALVRALALRAEERFATPGEFADALAHPETAVYPAAPLPEAAAPPAPVGRASTPVPAPVARHTTPITHPGFLGAPLAIVIEREIAGELPPDEHPALTEEIRATFGIQGHNTSTDRSLLWMARAPKKPFRWDNWDELMGQSMQSSAPDAFVRVHSRHGRTVIRIEQRFKDLAGGLFGGVMGGGGGGITATGLSLGLAVAGWPLVPLLMAAGSVVTGTWALSRSIYRMVIRNKHAELERLADRLVEYVEEVVV